MELEQDFWARITIPRCKRIRRCRGYKDRASGRSAFCHSWNCNTLNGSHHQGRSFQCRASDRSQPGPLDKYWRSTAIAIARLFSQVTEMLGRIRSPEVRISHKTPSGKPSNRRLLWRSLYVLRNHLLNIMLTHTITVVTRRPRVPPLSSKRIFAGEVGGEDKKRTWTLGFRELAFHEHLPRPCRGIQERFFDLDMGKFVALKGHVYGHGWFGCGTSTIPF